MTDLVEKSDYFDMAWSVVGKSFPVFSSYLMVIATWEMSSTYYPSDVAATYCHHQSVMTAAF